MENKKGVIFDIIYKIEMMKKLFLIPICTLLLFCSSKNNFSNNQDSIIIENTPSNCPENGVCETKIFRNQSLEIKTDEFGSMYYEKLESPTTSVILFTYTKNTPKDLPDSSYREEIIFEINNSDSDVELSDLNLQKTKMLFGRFCFCRGQTGYHKVKSGILKLKNADKKISFNLNFLISEVPQTIKSINNSVK